MTKDVSVSEATPLTGEELRGMFGDHLPMEAVELIWPEHFSKRPHFDPLHIVREKLRAIALRSNLKEQPVAPEGWVLVPQAALDWLNGEAPDPAGMEFGEFTEDHPKPAGAFWWRTVFRQICEFYAERLPPKSASPSSPVSRESALLREAREWINAADHDEHCFTNDPNPDACRCVCGKDSLLAAIDDLDISAPAPSVSREAVIGEAVAVATAWANDLRMPTCTRVAATKIAAAIRSLSPTDKGKPSFVELKRRAEIALDDLTAYAHNNEALEDACGESAKAMNAATWNRVKAEQALVAVRDMTFKSALSPEVGNDK